MKHLLFIPGAALSKWVYSVEAKLTTTMGKGTEPDEMMDKCVLLMAYAESEKPEDIISAIFEVDDDFLDLYFQVFYKTGESQ